MKTSPGFSTVAASLFAAREAIAKLDLIKDAKGDKADYIRLGTLLATVEPALFANGWMVVQGCEEIRDGMLLGINVITTLMHKTGEWIETSVPIPIIGARISKDKGGGYAERDPQAAGIAISYGRRYGLLAIISGATEDTDGARRSRTKRAALAKLSSSEAGRGTSFYPDGIMPVGQFAGTPMALLKKDRLRRAMAAAREAGQQQEALSISAELTRRATTPGWTEPATEPAEPTATKVVEATVAT